MKNIFLFIAVSLLCCQCFAQVVVDRKNKLTASVTEKYQTVIGKKSEVRHGPYEAIYNNTWVVAKGQYINDKKSGTWHFFNKYGQPLEVFNYDTNSLIDEAAEDSTSNFHYIFDGSKPGDHFTKPIKIGGRYYGYLPYLKAFKLPQDIQQANYLVTFELLISPLGRLADLKVHFRPGNEEQVFDINTELFKDGDRQFVLPATLNKQPVACRILIQCIVNNYGEVDM